VYFLRPKQSAMVRVHSLMVALHGSSNLAASYSDAAGSNWRVLCVAAAQYKTGLYCALRQAAAALTLAV
jgi:hypothetical protein